MTCNCNQIIKNVQYIVDIERTIMEILVEYTKTQDSEVDSVKTTRRREFKDATIVADIVIVLYMTHIITEGLLFPNVSTQSYGISEPRRIM